MSASRRRAERSRPGRNGRRRGEALARSVLALLFACATIWPVGAQDGSDGDAPTGTAGRVAEERVDGRIASGIEQSPRETRPPLLGETAEDWVLLGTKLHGGFGSYIALGVHIGLDARERLGAPPRSYDVTLQNGKAAPCACLADGLQLSTGATPGRGSLRVVSDIAAGDVFAIVTVRERTSGRTLTYTVPGEARELLDQWNKIPAAERLPALRTVPSSQLFERVERARPE